jgi:hypothetical protein
MVNKITITDEQKYSFWIATQKVLKNGAIFLLPSLVAYQLQAPENIGMIVSVVIYYIKNYLENK